MSGDIYNHWGESLQGYNQYYVTSTTHATSGLDGSEFVPFTIQWNQPATQEIPQQYINPWAHQEYANQWQVPQYSEPLIDPIVSERILKEAAQVADGWDPDENK